MVIGKIFGWVSLISGIFFIVAMPSIKEYMPDEFARSIILIGLILVGVGIFLLQA